MRNNLINREKCEQIKVHIEGLTGIENIGKKTREREYCDARKLYCYLSKTFTKASLTLIGDVLRDGFDHATVMNNINQFHELNDTGQLDCQSIVQESEKIFFDLRENYKDISHKLKALNPKRSFEHKRIELLMQIINKGHSIILRKTRRISQLEKQIKQLEDTTQNQT